ncbi:MAG: MBL fold metallo-hydrolase [Clostridia bacterium]|nr:MBL fold metallo-hydrolase [Clostridia bacterium]
MYPKKKLEKDYEGRIAPFKITGNVYFVGTYQESTHLIDTGGGLILIDPGSHAKLYLVIESIWELGFKPKDIMYIINTHWHKDHTGGTEALAAITGAETLIGEFDAEYVKDLEIFNPDILIKDGDTLALGNTSIKFMHTPGHTKGTISFFFDTEESGKTYRAGMFGGAGANSLVPEFKTYYEGCRRDYLNSVSKLSNEKVDVFLGNHTWNNNTEGKAEILKNTGENPFIDSGEWTKFLIYCKERCEKLG